jgi:hypothetical protein
MVNQQGPGIFYKDTYTRQYFLTGRFPGLSPSLDIATSGSRLLRGEEPG